MSLLIKLSINTGKKKTENLEDFVYEDEDGSFSIKDILLLDESAGVPILKCFRMRSGKSFLKLSMNFPKNRDWVYVENELNDKTLQEIADEQGENIKTIISRKNYAVKHLRSRLKQLYEDLNN